MTGVFSLSDYRQVDERGELLLGLGHLAIAGAHEELRHSTQVRELERELQSGVKRDESVGPHIDRRQLEEFSRQSRNGGPGWQQLLHDVSQPVAVEWLEALAVELATWSPLLDQDLLGGGAVQRRLDAVLDAMEISFCASDVHSTYGEVFEHLADEELTAGRYAIAFAGGAAKGALTVHGLGAVGDLVNKQAMTVATRRSAPEIITDELTRLVLQCWCLAEEASGAREVRRIRQGLVDDANKIAQELAETKRRGYDTSLQQRRLNAVRRAAGLLEADEGTGGQETQGKVVVPDLIGQRFSDAQEMLEMLGLRVHGEDCLQPNGSPRFIMNAGNWRVSTQGALSGSVLSAGERVELGVKKFGEH